jgi:hypothetical protein
MKLFSRVKDFAVKRKALVIAFAAIAILLLSPFAVKAATGGEIDLYAMLQELFTRVEAQDELLADQAAQIEAQGTEMAELKDRLAAVEAQEPSAPPASDPGNSGGGSGGSTPDPGPNPAPEPDPEPEPDPAPAPEKINPYRNCTLDGVHVCTIDGMAHFGKWLIDVGGTEIERLSGIVAVDGKVICFTNREKDRAEAYLTGEGIAFTTTPIPVDPLLYEIVAGKVFGSRTDAIKYIESVIAGDIKP